MDEDRCCIDSRHAVPEAEHPVRQCTLASTPTARHEMLACQPAGYRYQELSPEDRAPRLGEA